MISQIVEANNFELQGVNNHKEVYISYSPTSITGKPLFNYKESEGTCSLIGNEILIQNMEIGTMVTATLEFVADDHTTTITLLVPAINLRDNSEQKFNTVAIRTTSKTNVSKVPIVKQFYEVIDLQGTARHVFY
jgi:hypothetical protein